MMEKLRNLYREVLIERDNLAHENKRIRHDYDVYVKQNDQVSEKYFFNISFSLLSMISGQILSSR